ncbi:MAG: amidohydrolase family protein [Chloroflexi bacterium]|nr:amidohydrolase family protein [Chloroflexota bacterium]
MKIDTHQHFWKLSEVAYPWLIPDYGPIYDTFTPELLAPQVHAAGVDKTVLVQSADSYEDTASMLVKADYNDWIGGVVGWVNLLNPDETNQRLEMYKQHPKFKGIRHLIHTEADGNWVVQDVVLESLNILASHGMTFDVVAVFPNHLKHVPTLCEKVPDLKMVIDHLAKPPVGQSETPWFEQMDAAAKSPNVYAKLSGQFDNPDWSVADVQPYVDFVLDKFGPNRVMFGSDWPVCILGGSYASVWDNTQTLLSGLSDADRDAVLGGTAVSFYSLDS